MSALSTVQIKEANAHLAALHHRVAELEGTIREQAESLIRKDEQYQASIRDMVEAKDRAIAELQKRLAQSEEEMQKLMSSIKDKDRELERLRHHSRLMARMCHSRPLLNALVSLMAEAEGIPCLPHVEQCNGLPSVPDYAQSEEDLEDSDVDRTLFGTTV
ncbi:vimentin-type intermediate filament-associated coiled-coil protein [Bufo gargarizans]|uniref:vimentin-type intermediate filament-associated coiled-coil protein n=1 Tax=Bufo gargarizans TaxID=30331 RepID=UPI001CF2955B|nr:vimentin-type intermediate filament-associated coiled-coil protein [Bufo gargarizans]XP_044157337.1 vimentin-type intermediate filament-associated coiled-coil protein [Bufo gargarizans]